MYYAAAQTAMDLRSGAYTGGGPEDFLFGAATNELADFYNVPLSMGAYATGAKRSDWQAGLENGLSAFMASVVGLGHAPRRRAAPRVPDLVLRADDPRHRDRIGIVHAMLEGIPVDDASLALEAIAEVGPGGEYLTLAPHADGACTACGSHATWTGARTASGRRTPTSTTARRSSAPARCCATTGPSRSTRRVDAELRRLIAAHAGAAGVA